jgi:hypothetical protein
LELAVEAHADFEGVHDGVDGGWWEMGRRSWWNWTTWWTG